jgi:chitinase
VTDTTGLSDSESRSVTINVLPTPHFIARHDGRSVSFDATGSFHALGVGITSYAWDFDDGTTGSGQRVTHDYTTPNRYIVELTVTDAPNFSQAMNAWMRPRIVPKKPKSGSMPITTTK